MLINIICKEERREVHLSSTMEDDGLQWDVHEETGIEAVPCLSLHVLRSMQRLHGGNALKMCKYMHAHLPKTMINGH